MLHADANIKLFKVDGVEYSRIHKSIKQSYVSKHYFVIEKKAIRLLIPDDKSIEEELRTKMDLIVNIWDKAKLTKRNDIYYYDNSKNNVFIEK